MSVYLIIQGTERERERDNFFSGSRCQSWTRDIILIKYDEPRVCLAIVVKTISESILWKQIPFASYRATRFENKEEKLNADGERIDDKNERVMKGWIN